MSKIFITGAAGLIGTVLGGILEAAGHQVVGYDIADSLDQDIVDAARMTEAMQGCNGVIHLAAVSRVVWGQRDPQKCNMVNVQGTKNVYDAAIANGTAWAIYASSREVYGSPKILPVHEDFAINAMNVYGRSKAAAEELTIAARASGLNTQICRFSNVYGLTSDHKDRVLPAFTRAAVLGQELRLEGGANVFDFNHVNDTADGVARIVTQLEKGEKLPAIHFATGRGTSLDELAAMSIKAAGATGATMREYPARNYDVDRFVGDYTRAKTLLGWQPRISLEDGVADMVRRWKALEGEDTTAALAVPATPEIKIPAYA